MIDKTIWKIRNQISIKECDSCRTWWSIDSFTIVVRCFCAFFFLYLSWSKRLMPFTWNISLYRFFLWRGIFVFRCFVFIYLLFIFRLFLFFVFFWGFFLFFFLFFFFFFFIFFSMEDEYCRCITINRNVYFTN
jgi:hypothetical protein